LTDFSEWEYKDKLTGLYNWNYLETESWRKRAMYREKQASRAARE